jgi:hypothetical protein
MWDAILAKGVVCVADALHAIYTPYIEDRWLIDSESIIAMDACRRLLDCYAPCIVYPPNEPWMSDM